MAKVQPEADKLNHGQFVKDSPEWRTAQAAALREAKQMALDCHPWIGAVQCGIYIRDPELMVKPVRIGTAYYCPFEDFDKSISKSRKCLKVSKRCRMFKSVWPSDWRRELWDDMRAAGPCFPMGGPEFAVYCERRDQFLEAYAHPGRKIQWSPREEDLKVEGKIPSHGYSRIDKMAGDAYIKEPEKF